MRIIAGKHRGRVIRIPQDSGARPTLDRVRESVFNILMHGIVWPGFEGEPVLDVFAGSGAFGLEALSRGASLATFIDIDSEILKAIRRNAATLGEARNITELKLDATRLPPPPRAAGAPCVLVNLDPPYFSGLAVSALQGLKTKGWLRYGAIAVVEVAAQELFAPPRDYVALEERGYGAARVIFVQLQ